jgi:UDP-4-amino-4,6-dideoxy-N-acetyl-beta-L-altrosamine transaminase
MIPYGRQSITSQDIERVIEVLRSDYLTQGPCVPAFESAVAAKVNARFGVAVNSATSALHVACLALDLGPGDVLWTVPNTFVASANCARYCGADVDFVDIDANTWNISLAGLTKKLEAARKAGRVPKVLVPVHFAGQPTAQEAIWELSKSFGFRVLEDASHAIGASRFDEPVGSCRWSDITVFSFHPVKIITTAEGGMAMTNDPGLARAMTELRSHGITRDPNRFAGRAVGPVHGVVSERGAWYYEQIDLGFNYRMTDLHAALGRSQLERLDAYVERRNQLADRYSRSLSGLPLRLPQVEAGNKSAFHLYVVRLLSGSGRPTQRAVFDALRERGIGVNVHYLPVHCQPYYQALGFRRGSCPEAEAHGDTAITLPLFPGMSDEEQDRVIAAVREVILGS